MSSYPTVLSVQSDPKPLRNANVEYGVGFQGGGRRGNAHTLATSDSIEIVAVFRFFRVLWNESMYGILWYETRRVPPLLHVYLMLAK